MDRRVRRRRGATASLHVPERCSYDPAKIERIHGIGRIFRFGKLPVNAQIGAYYNVVKPDFGPNWQIRAQVQFMFPK
jgi:hypothetical protein